MVKVSDTVTLSQREKEGGKKPDDGKSRFCLTESRNQIRKEKCKSLTWRKTHAHRGDHLPLSFLCRDRVRQKCSFVYEPHINSQLLSMNRKKRKKTAKESKDRKPRTAKQTKKKKKKKGAGTGQNKTVLCTQPGGGGVRKKEEIEKKKKNVNGSKLTRGREREREREK